MMIFQSIIGEVELTNERKSHIILKHPELKTHIKKISQVLSSPDTIRRSKLDEESLLFYKYFDTIKKGKYISVTVKKGKRNFILTAYITDKIRAGEIYESEKEA
ncbi:hypothetical protein HYT18_00640 [Candidatus Microgenomates bacterium]|nr:hypothetical protein [Candidatus Microgenomates bacterium]